MTQAIHSDPCPPPPSRYSTPASGSLLRCPLPNQAILGGPKHPLALPASAFPAAHGTPAVCSASPHLECLLPLFRTLAWGKSP